MLISSLPGKAVLTRSGEWLGYVVALTLTRDMKKLSCLICADAEEEEFLLPARAVLSAGDAVIARRQRAERATGVPSPIGRQVFSHTGEELGVIADVDTGEAPALIVRGEEERRVAVLCAAMDQTVIVYPTPEERRAASGTRSKTRSPKPKPQPAPIAAAPKAAPEGAPNPKRMPVPSPLPQPLPQPAPFPAPPVQPAPPDTEGAPPDTDRTTPRSAPSPAPPAETNVWRIDRTNLLGRRVKRSVFDDAGKPVALAGERITPETLKRARRHNRLLALTVNTLTNLV